MSWKEPLSYSPEDYNKPRDPQRIIAEFQAAEIAFVAQHGTILDQEHLLGSSAGAEAFKNYCRQFEQTIGVSVTFEHKSGKLLFSSQIDYGDPLATVFTTFEFIDTLGRCSRGMIDMGRSSSTQISWESWVSTYISQINRAKRERDSSIKFGLFGRRRY